jgi:hypothetical protein
MFKLPTIAEQHSGRCVHFNGIQHDACRLDVKYVAVRDTSDRPYAWPCLTNDRREATTTCASRRMPTPEETAAHVAKTEAWLAALEAKERRGECVDCGNPIEHAVQIGACMYARPCGCRIGQGNAREFNAVLVSRRNVSVADSGTSGADHTA